MKKLITILMCVLFILTMFTGCGSSPASAPNNPASSASESNSETDTPEPSNSEAVQLAPNVQTESVPTVYMTTHISPEGLMAVYEALGWMPSGNVAVKLSTGEPPNSNYLKPELIKDLVQLDDGTIVECNTAYGGSRAETAMHYQVAED